MATRSMRPCTHPGCGALVTAGRCERHQVAVRRADDQRRGSAHSRGYDYRWRKYAKRFLREHPLCECPVCRAGAGVVRQSEVVDHIVPHRGDMALFWDPANHQAMAKQCHDRKTATEDGGWGRAGRARG